MPATTTTTKMCVNWKKMRDCTSEVSSRSCAPGPPHWLAGSFSLLHSPLFHNRPPTGSSLPLLACVHAPPSALMIVFNHEESHLMPLHKSFHAAAAAWLTGYTPHPLPSLVESAISIIKVFPWIPELATLFHSIAPLNLLFSLPLCPLCFSSPGEP